MMTMITDPNRMPLSSSSSGQNSSKLMIKPRKIARPPIRGIGTLCIRRASLGTSMAPTRQAKDLTIGVARKLTISATASASTMVAIIVNSFNIRFYPPNDGGPHRSTKPTFL